MFLGGSKFWHQGIQCSNNARQNASLLELSRRSILMLAAFEPFSFSSPRRDLWLAGLLACLAVQVNKWFAVSHTLCEVYTRQCSLTSRDKCRIPLDTQPVLDSVFD